MKTTFIALIIACVFLAVLTSCGKDTTSKTNTQFLIQQAWKIETHGLDENNNGVIEQSESDMLSCQVDDVFTFSPGGAGIYSPGSLTCSPDDSTSHFNWSFSNNETELSIAAYPEKISELNDNTLEIYYDEQNSQGQTVKYIERFKH